MKERPILFSAPMVRAILEGRKTATRRVVKLVTPKTRNVQDWSVDGVRVGPCPYGQPGDRLWVREAWRASHDLNSTPPREITKDSSVVYEATMPSYSELGIVGKLRPSMFMPRWASRITLEVTGVRVERLQDMTTDQAIAEGMRTFPHKGGTAYAWDADDAHGFGSATGAFRWLWDSINGDGAHHADPWVWVVEFKRVTP